VPVQTVMTVGVRPQCVEAWREAVADNGMRIDVSDALGLVELLEFIRDFSARRGRAWSRWTSSMP
jgi:hypothetical protein